MWMKAAKAHWSTDNRKNKSNGCEQAGRDQTANPSVHGECNFSSKFLGAEMWTWIIQL